MHRGNLKLRVETGKNCRPRSLVLLRFSVMRTELKTGFHGAESAESLPNVPAGCAALGIFLRSPAEARNAVSAGQENFRLSAEIDLPVFENLSKLPVSQTRAGGSDNVSSRHNRFPPWKSRGDASPTTLTDESTKKGKQPHWLLPFFRSAFPKNLTLNKFHCSDENLRS